MSDMRQYMRLVESQGMSDVDVSEVYHGTCPRLWKKSGAGVGFNLYLVSDRAEAESYANEACKSSRDKPIIVTFTMHGLLALEHGTPSVELDPDWGWVDSYENELKNRGEVLEENPTWQESFEAVGSFCVAGFKDEFKNLGRVEEA